MRQHVSRSAVVGLAIGVLFLVSGCGDEPADPPRADEATASASPTAAAADTSLGEGAWLLALSTAGGADAEKATTTYLTYNPSTGQATARALPGVSTPNADADEAALLVSSDRRWAIPDTGLTRSEEKSGKLTVYSLTSKATQVLDLPALSGDSGLVPLGWAFDPNQPSTLRVVDAKNGVWTVDVTGGPATKTGTLPRGAWVFGNGFNPNSGEPYVESITDETTNPAGNGAADTTPVTRAGGTVLTVDSPGFAELPKGPCRLGAAFVASDGTTWQFCADGATIQAYYLPDGGERWSSYGKSSSAVAPEAAGFWFALPPQ